MHRTRSAGLSDSAAGVVFHPAEAEKSRKSPPLPEQRRSDGHSSPRIDKRQLTDGQRVLAAGDGGCFSSAARGKSAGRLLTNGHLSMMRSATVGRPSGDQNLHSNYVYRQWSGHTQHLQQQLHRQRQPTNGPMWNEHRENFYDNCRYGSLEHQRRHQQQSGTYFLLEMLRRGDEKRQLDEIPATPRLVRSDRVRPTIVAPSSVPVQRKNMRHYAENCPSSICRSSATGLKSGSATLNRLSERSSSTDDTQLPTPEQAQTCLAAHLNGIYQLFSTNNVAGSLCGRDDLLSDSNDHLLGSTDLLLNPTAGRGRPSRDMPRVGYQSGRQPGGCHQSQESLMSLMSTSTTSVAAPGMMPFVRHHNGGSSSGNGSIGQQSPSMMPRSSCRQYSGHHHQYQRSAAGCSSNCSSRSSDCGFGVGNASRAHAYRRSARNLNVKLPRNSEVSAGRSSSLSLQADIRPMAFEVPSIDGESIFVGRDWVCHELYEILVKATFAENGMKGAVVFGGVGTGKTAIVNQLASYCPLAGGQDPYHLNASNYMNYVVNSSPSSDRTSSGQQKNRASNSTDSGFVSGSKQSLNKHSTPQVPPRHNMPPSPPPRPPLPDWHRHVCQSIAAYHLCQIENQSTCTLAEFLCNIGAMLACSPQLTAYRDMLAQQPELQTLLQPEEMLKDPLNTFKRAVTEPLLQLRKCGKVSAERCMLILVDGLDEAEFHRPEFGDSIASFLVKHALTVFPEWLKLVLTVKTLSLELVKGLPLHKINLDNVVLDERVYKDSVDYIQLRIGQSTTIQTNVGNTKLAGDGGSSVGPGSSTSSSTAVCPWARFAEHLAATAKGNFLYLKLTLNLIEKNYLVMKGANYKVLPINLAEVFLLLFNLRFPTARAFEKTAPLLNAVLASLRPLTSPELYEIVSSSFVNEFITWEEFQERIFALNDYLLRKQDETYVFFHPAFRDWLIRREDGQSPKFLCDLRYGHALLALRLARRSTRLNAEELQEMGHHLLKAHIYKRTQDKAVDAELAAVGRDCQLLCLNQSAADIRTSLSSRRNVCQPNSKVSRLLLLAGASADASTPNFTLPNDEQQQQQQTTTSDWQTPLMCTAAFYGQHEFAGLLLEFGADVGATESLAGRSPLMLAAAEGHLDMVQLLHQHDAKVSQVDARQRCALVHAAERGQAHVLSFLLQCDWSEADGREQSMTTSAYGYGLRQQAAQQAFVAAAAAGRTSICKFLLDVGDVLVDEPDPVSGETALSAACANARKETVGYLLNHAGARFAYGRQNEKPFPPLLQAVANGCWEIVSTLLARQLDVDGERNATGQTALMIAAQHGHIGVLELLLSRNASVSATDDDRRTALHWACLHDQSGAASLLLDRDALLLIFDNHGFGPIHYAAQHGSKQLVQLLLDRCPQLLETPTKSSSRLRPLELGILADNLESVQRCLKKGAKLAPSTWAFAQDKPPVMIALLNKLLEDGQLLYRKNRLADAEHRFSYALKKMPKSNAATTTPIDGGTESTEEFDRLRFHLLLNYARCQRKSGDSKSAAHTCTEALLCRQSAGRAEWQAEAYVCRARCFCELRQFTNAADDLRHALTVWPTNREAQQLLVKVKQALEQQASERPTDAGQLNVESVSLHSPQPTSAGNGRADIGDRSRSAESPNSSRSSADSGTMPDMVEDASVSVAPRKPSNDRQQSRLNDRTPVVHSRTSLQGTETAL